MKSLKDAEIEFLELCADAFEAEEQLARIEAARCANASSEDYQRVVSRHQTEIKRLSDFMGVTELIEAERQKRLEAQYAQNRAALWDFFGKKENPWRANS